MASLWVRLRNRGASRQLGAGRVGKPRAGPQGPRDPEEQWRCGHTLKRCVRDGCGAWAWSRTGESMGHGAWAWTVGRAARAGMGALRRRGPSACRLAGGRFSPLMELHSPNPGLRCWAGFQGPSRGLDLMRWVQAFPAGPAWATSPWVRAPALEDAVGPAPQPEAGQLTGEAGQVVGRLGEAGCWVGPGFPPPACPCPGATAGCVPLTPAGDSQPGRARSHTGWRPPRNLWIWHQQGGLI